MKKYLLPKEGTFYKANLHSHSSCSDGRFSPEEMKKNYREQGYSVLAFSDHDVLREHNELTDDDFLALTAYEISIRSDDTTIPHAFRKIVDLNLLSKNPYNLTQCGYHPQTVEWWVQHNKITQEEADNIKYAGELRDLCYYPANINKIIKTANENGFLVTINHPVWNNVSGADYAAMEGAWAIEVYNNGCFEEGGFCDSEVFYDEVLRSGKKIFAVAADDNHNWINDSFGGFTMIKAAELKYDAVISALEKGYFYASSGPMIEELYYEDGYVHIKTSPAADISMNTLGRKGFRRAAGNGEHITEASFKIDPELFGLVRFRVRDEKGKCAWTNSYYVDEFMPEAKKIRAII